MADPWLVAVSSAARRDIEVLSSQAAPAEAIGALVGRRKPGSRRIEVEKVVPLANQAARHADRSFRVDPRQILQLEREFHEGEPSVLGYFHSHPSGPNEPSSEDLQTAWPEYVYLLAVPAKPDGWRTVLYPAGSTRTQPGDPWTNLNGELPEVGSRWPT